MIELHCPYCCHSLKISESVAYCEACSYQLKNEDGVWIDVSLSQETQDKNFYESVYSKEKGAHWLQGLNRDNFFKRLLEKISLSYRRERFFKHYLKGKQKKILDLACGAGRDYFKNYGEVVGVDLIKGPLIIAKKNYQQVIQAGISSLPFPDNYFDYVVSSDIFGHIRLQDKDNIIKEILRVLKPGGLTLHVIETDSTNVWFRMAHGRPELFQKYFIEQIGGHVGLELPSQCVSRWQHNGFMMVKVIKIWGLIWPIQDYAGLFDNKYQQGSIFLHCVVTISKILSKYRLIKIGINIILNPINYLIELFWPLDNGQGIMMVCKKSL